MNNLVVFVVLLLLVSFAVWHKDTFLGSTSEPVTPTTTIDTPPQPVAPITVDQPQQNATVSQTFTVSGKAPGPWYFEASFPVIITDAQNNELTAVPAQAQSEWMTTDMVPFLATINVGAYTGPATITFRKDNPSGLPEHDQSYSFPITIQ